MGKEKSRCRLSADVLKIKKCHSNDCYGELPLLVQRNGQHQVDKMSPVSLERGEESKRARKVNSATNNRSLRRIPHKRRKR